MNEIPKDQVLTDIEYLNNKIAELDVALEKYLYEKKLSARKCQCGTERDRLVLKRDDVRNKYRVICLNCKARTRYYWDFEQAWNMWNDSILAVK